MKQFSIVLSSFFLSLCTYPFIDLLAQQPSETQTLFHKLMFTEHHETGHSLLGHSHNDYNQEIPFFTAYHAGMTSIEVDLFLRDGHLYAAHEAREIRSGHTLEELYLKPLSRYFAENKGYPFQDTTKHLQLLLDLKEDYHQLLPELQSLLHDYKHIIDPSINPHALRIVISGNMPPQSAFGQYASYFYYDGRPDIDYTPDQLRQVALISDALSNYTRWNGKGVPSDSEQQSIISTINKATQQGKPFRFWGAPENVNAWIILEKMGVRYLNTDHPYRLREYLDQLDYSRYQSKEKNQHVYQPTYKTDGATNSPKNIILLIGDGMGLAHIQSAQIANRGQLHMTKMRHIGFSNTSSLSNGNTDSAAGGTAIATGRKTTNGKISVDSSNRPLSRLPELLRSYHLETAIISTGDIADATPAVFYASHSDRNDERAIMSQLFRKDAPFFIGGKLPGSFTDDTQRKKLYSELANFGYTVHETIDTLDPVHKNAVLLPAEATRPIKDGRGDILVQMMNNAIKLFQKRKTHFFMMAEAAQIDYGGHARDIAYITTETLDLDRAVGEALRFADQNGETLVIVTADHETGALSILDHDHSTGKLQVHFASNDHSSIHVPVMAYGPGAQEFIGFYQNTELFNKIMQVIAKGD